jgi:hypothetical protein
MQKAKFTGIDENTHKDWEIIQQYDNAYLAGLPDTIIATLERLGEGHHAGSNVSNDAVNGGV